ncbi:Arc family DNA-binding protein [Aeromonas bestiarum]|uniref:Arc family DNA-binding protein n=1 Tax=Aeromonas bestiarum TaxID=105751 RepID=A0AAW7I2G7_9GAMM|nr:Arc family DNA-binding protein [Aeromonas bestiarum]MDM5138443.1 Arc family DNA-binding protein [Aeromonas bestiarum]
MMNKKSTVQTSRESDKFVLRLPDGMRAEIAELAKASGRSMNAEIVYRLQRTFDEDTWSIDGIQSQSQVPSDTPRQYQRKQKYSIQSDMPDEAMQELMARIQEVWDKYKSAQDK